MVGVIIDIGGGLGGGVGGPGGGPGGGFSEIIEVVASHYCNQDFKRPPPGPPKSPPGPPTPPPRPPPMSLIPPTTIIPSSRVIVFFPPPPVFVFKHGGLTNKLTFLEILEGLERPGMLIAFMCPIFVKNARYGVN